MNPFGNIVDLTGLNGIEPGKNGLGSVNNVDPKSSGIDFSQILGGKLSGELPFLFGEETNQVGAGLVNPEEILESKLAESMLSDLSGDMTSTETEELISQNNLIDPKQISSEQFLKANTAEMINYREKLSNIITDLSAPLNMKEEGSNIAVNRSAFNPELKIDNLNLNSIDLTFTQLGTDEPDAKIRPTVLAEIDKELMPKNSVDLKTAGLIEKVAVSLNIKNIKLDKNFENNQVDKEPVKLALPTKSYIKVTAIDEHPSANNKQFAETKQNLFSGNTEIIRPEIKTGDGEKVRLNNFEAIARVELDQKQVSINETGQAGSQTKLISDFAPSLGNNIEKIEIKETKIDVMPAKFVLPAEISGKNLKNNHTVMIRMEPDHLGPVRMTVTTHNDILSARLIVDSPLAKATVESNLNNLVEQLDRHGIKVDRIEVSVSGGAVGHEAKENRFAGSKGTGRHNPKGYKTLSAIKEVMAQRAQDQLYIAANGVNCFA